MSRGLLVTLRFALCASSSSLSSKASPSSPPRACTLLSEHTVRTSRPGSWVTSSQLALHSSKIWASSCRPGARTRMRTALVVWELSENRSRSRGSGARVFPAPHGKTSVARFHVPGSSSVNPSVNHLHNRRAARSCRRVTRAKRARRLLSRSGGSLSSSSSSSSEEDSEGWNKSSPRSSSPFSLSFDSSLYESSRGSCCDECSPWPID